ncbi:MAG: N-formylglutamate deformylase [Lysobacteraceae bacterium]
MTHIARLIKGRSPLLVSLPHDGVALPPELVPRLTPAARAVPDTDWHMARLYAFARRLGASILIPLNSRYLIDLNRSREDANLYPGKNTTGLCPTHRFDGGPVYLPGEEPSADEVGERIERYWQPYHDALRDELERKRALHGRALLWEGHSIRSELPWLFDGRLPDLNLGTADGKSCSAYVETCVSRVAASQSDYSWVLNGRFKGGYITRHYGRPAEGVEAIQMELAQCLYMDEDSTAWQLDRAERLQALLLAMLRAMID